MDVDQPEAPPPPMASARHPSPSNEQGWDLKSPPLLERVQQEDAFMDTESPGAGDQQRKESQARKRKNLSQTPDRRVQRTENSATAPSKGPPSASQSKLKGLTSPLSPSMACKEHLYRFRVINKSKLHWAEAL
eukprot:scaffold192_cov190-Pinguiococcus_pyrenoidosus.AAC.10